MFLKERKERVDLELKKMFKNRRNINSNSSNSFLFLFVGMMLIFLQGSLRTNSESFNAEGLINTEAFSAISNLVSMLSFFFGAFFIIKALISLSRQETNNNFHENNVMKFREKDFIIYLSLYSKYLKEEDFKNYVIEKYKKTSPEERIKYKKIDDIDLLTNIKIIDKLIEKDANLELEKLSIEESKIKSKISKQKEVLGIEEFDIEND